MRPFLTICLISTFLTTGCSGQREKIPPAIEGPLFCDIVTERFRYTQPEIDLRAEKFPANLRREFEINLSFDAECVDPAADGSGG